MEHEPSGLLGDAKVLRNLMTADTVFAVDNKPESSQPLVQTKGRIFKNGSLLDRKLAAAFLALPSFLRVQPIMILACTTGASRYTVRPAQHRDGSYAYQFILEVKNRLLQCCWKLAHGVLHYPTIQQSNWLVKYIYAV